MAIGLEREFIDDSCPTDLQPYVEAHKIRLKEQDAANWQLGIYFMRAMSVCFNFSKEKIEYFERPLIEQMEYEQSREYKIAQQERLFAALKIMQDNFNRSRGK